MRTNKAQPLLPFHGNVKVPCWALRPGGVEALQRATKGLPLWLLIRSSNGGKLRPCTASRDTLAATLGVSVRTLGDHLKALRAAQGLFIEFRRPTDPKTGRLRPPVRVAVDPLQLWADRKRLEERLPEVAEESNLGAGWVRRALRLVEQRDEKIRRLAHQISEDIYGRAPRANPAPGEDSSPYEGGGGEGGRPEPLEGEAA